MENSLYIQELFEGILKVFKVYLGVNGVSGVILYGPIVHRVV
jgi:hypothetical protein